MANAAEKPPLPIGLSVILLGAVGFAAGFFGPMILSPESNQGPMLGIFIAGPGGAALGLVTGVLLRLAPIGNAVRWRVLTAVGAVLALVTLTYSLPEPETQGLLLRGRVAECRPAAELMPEAIRHWEKRIGEVTRASPRPNWQADARRIVRDTPGVMLRFDVEQQNLIRRHRKPWNSGRVDARGWREERYTKDFFADFAGASCDAYTGELPVLYMQLGQYSNAWPPDIAWNFLNLARIEEAPARYLALTH